MTYLLATWTTLAAGLLCTASSAALGLTEILHGPDCPNYRFLPFWVRFPMMCWAIALAYRAFDLLDSLALHQPQPIGVSGVIAGVMQTACLSVFLAETLRSRLSERTQRWIARIYDLSRCGGKRGKGLAELTARGAIVVAPGERRLPPEFR